MKYGGDSEEVTPVLMPNTEVKFFSADGSWGLPPARVGRCHIFLSLMYKHYHNGYTKYCRVEEETLSKFNTEWSNKQSTVEKTSSCLDAKSSMNNLEKVEAY